MLRRERLLRVLDRRLMMLEFGKGGKGGGLLLWFNATILKVISVGLE